MPRPPSEWFPSESELADPRKAARVVRDLYQRVYASERKQAELMKQLDGLLRGRSRDGNAALTLDEIERALSSGGSHALDVEGLTGLLAQVQRAGGRTGTSLPPNSQGTEREFFVLNSGGIRTLYQFADGSWQAVTATAGAHASSHYAGGSDPLTGALDANARVQTRTDGTDIALRRAINFLDTVGIDVTGADDAGNEESEITITRKFLGVRAYFDSAQTIPDSTPTLVTFPNENYDSDAFHDGGGANPGRLTVPAGKAGKYLIQGEVFFNTSATGYRVVQLVADVGLPVYVGYVVMPGVAGTTLPVQIHGIYNLAATNFVEMYVTQNTGGDLDINEGWLAMTWQGP